MMVRLVLLLLILLSSFLESIPGNKLTTSQSSTLQPYAASTIATISVGSTPYGVGVNPSTSRVYVANSGEGTVSVINSVTNTLVTNITVQSGPIDIGVNSATNRIYVTNQGTNSVSVINGANNSI